MFTCCCYCHCCCANHRRTERLLFTFESFLVFFCICSVFYLVERQICLYSFSFYCHICRRSMHTSAKINIRILDRIDCYLIYLFLVVVVVIVVSATIIYHFVSGGKFSDTVQYFYCSLYLCIWMWFCPRQNGQLMANTTKKTITTKATIAQTAKVLVCNF